MVLTIKLLKRYLTYREQFVHTQKHNSGLVNPKTVVPQESILGPLLLHIYQDIHDIVNAALYIIIYTDDTTLVVNLCFFYKLTKKVQFPILSITNTDL